MTNGLVVTSIATAVVSSSPILTAATGELFAETVGIYNIGIEGAMLGGALAGFVGASQTGSIAVGLLFAIAVGAAIALLFGLAVVGLRANIVVAGLAATFLTIGLTGTLGNSYVRQTIPSTIPSWNIPLLSKIPYVGPALFQQPLFVYVSVVLPVIAWWVLFRTSHGLNMRAIGENPAAADAAGVSVTVWRLLYTTIGGGFAGLAGGFLTLGIIGTWLPQITAGEGYIALGVVIFSSWRPFPLILGALLFGALGTLGDVGQALGWSVPSAFFSALPYVGTLAVLTVIAWARKERGGRPPWPAGLGVAFFRGQ
jgi:simple sugar transport system permease protein